MLISIPIPFEKNKTKQNKTKQNKKTNNRCSSL